MGIIMLAESCPERGREAAPPNGTNQRSAIRHPRIFSINWQRKRFHSHESFHRAANSSQAAEMNVASEPVLDVVLYAPEIPPNTGNIGRTCVAVGAKLWLVKPIGYSLEDKYLKRAGLDYWQFLNYEVVESWLHLLDRLGPDRQFWFLTKFATQLVWDVQFQRRDVLVFGSESRGLPVEIRTQHADSCLKLPMLDEVRSLNLASAATAVIYEAIRQFGGV